MSVCQSVTLTVFYQFYFRSSSSFLCECFLSNFLIRPRKKNVNVSKFRFFVTYVKTVFIVMRLDFFPLICAWQIIVITSCAFGHWLLENHLLFIHRPFFVHSSSTRRSFPPITHSALGFSCRVRLSQKRPAVESSCHHCFRYSCSVLWNRGYNRIGARFSFTYMIHIDPHASFSIIRYSLLNFIYETCDNKFERL